MLTKLMLSLVLVSSFVVGCAAPTATPVPASPIPATVAPSQPTPAPAQSGKIRLATGEPSNVDSIPRLLAVDSLREQGYTIDLVEFADTSLTVASIVKGDVDIANGSNQSTWAAIAKGAPIRAFLGRTNNTQLLLTPTTIQKCQDLQGKKVGVSNITGSVPLMIKDYVSKSCPGTQFEFVTIASSINRRAALIAGSLDASPSQTDDLLALERDAPGKFHILVDLGQEFPNLQISSYYLRQEFASQHPELVKAFVRAMILANRTVQDKTVLRDAITKYLAFKPEDAEKAAAAYLAVNQWDVNGGETREKIEYTLAFLKKSGLAADLKPEDVADLAFVNAVLDEIGRK